MKPAITFPWREKNSFKLLVDSDSFIPEMLQAIDHSESFVFLEQYLMESGKVLDMFINSLSMASERGVKVYVLFDDYGCSGVNTKDFQKLQNARIRTAHYNPFRWSHLYKSMRRNHRKLLLVDGKLAFVGGACLSDKYQFKQPDTMSWHDVVVKIRGEVVYDWHQSFASIWHTISDEGLPPVEMTSVTDTDQRGRVLVAQGPGRNQIIRTAISQINKSRRQVWIATPYFLTTRKLRHALKKATTRGVDVCLLLPGAISDHPWISQASRRYYTRLLKNGISIFEYQPRFIHAKLILCDNWVSIGSSNLDRWNQFWNLDANQAIEDDDFLEQAISMFMTDFAASTRITYAQWKTRPVVQRISEWWSSYIVRAIQWLVYFSTRITKTPKQK